MTELLVVKNKDGQCQIMPPFRYKDGDYRQSGWWDRVEIAKWHIRQLNNHENYEEEKELKELTYKKYKEYKLYE